MNNDINGWSQVAACLAARHRPQADLAKLLNITPSAVTQAKQGKIAFNAAQLGAICVFLGMSGEEKERFYRSIFDSRIMDRAPIPQLIPIIDAPDSIELTGEMLKIYDPQTEDLQCFLQRHRIVPRDGVVRVKLPFPPHRVTVRLAERPQAGERVIAVTADNEIKIAVYNPLQCDAIKWLRSISGE